MKTNRNIAKLDYHIRAPETELLLTFHSPLIIVKEANIEREHHAATLQ